MSRFPSEYTISAVPCHSAARITCGPCPTTRSPRRRRGPRERHHVAAVLAVEGFPRVRRALRRAPLGAHVHGHHHPRPALRGPPHDAAHRGQVARVRPDPHAEAQERHRVPPRRGHHGGDAVRPGDPHPGGLQVAHGLAPPRPSRVARVVVGHVAHHRRAVRAGTRRSAAAVATGMRKAKQAVEPGAHLRRAGGPSPMAPSTLSSTTSASATSGRSGASSESGSGNGSTRIPYLAEAERAQPGSRLVPIVTSPPAQTRTTPAPRVSARTVSRASGSWARAGAAAGRAPGAPACCGVRGSARAGADSGSAGRFRPPIYAVVSDFASADGGGPLRSPGGTAAGSPPRAPGASRNCPAVSLRRGEPRQTAGESPPVQIGGYHGTANGKRRPHRRIPVGAPLRTAYFVLPFTSQFPAAAPGSGR